MSVCKVGWFKAGLLLKDTQSEIKQIIVGLKN